jgi:hypothetical protein
MSLAHASDTGTGRWLIILEDSRENVEMLRTADNRSDVG